MPLGLLQKMKKDNLTSPSAQNMALVEEAIAHLDRRTPAEDTAQGNTSPDLIAEQANDSETLSDDVALPTELVQKIKQEEALIREVLALFDVDYNALISLEEKSPYAQAVKANPRIVEMVAQAPSPVVAALKVATQFQPYAEFMNSYGDTPEAIKEKLRTEIMAELESQQKSEISSKTNGHVNPFSTVRSGGIKKPESAQYASNSSFNSAFERTLSK